MQKVEVIKIDEFDFSDKETFYLGTSDIGVDTGPMYIRFYVKDHTSIMFKLLGIVETDGKILGWRYYSLSKDYGGDMLLIRD